jgi:RNA polymerase sigma-70 factor (ECF subfamily)
MTDRALFEAQVLPHLDAAYNLARWLTRDPHDAEDVVQEACMRALRYFRSLREGGARAWFLTIVRHASYDWIERHRDRGGGDAEVEVAADTESEPAQVAERRGDSRALAQAIAALELPYREVIVLRELEELSYKEIANVAAIPIGTVMSRLARARALLRQSPVLHAIAPRRSGGER